MTDKKLKKHVVRVYKADADGGNVDTSVWIDVLRRDRFVASQNAGGQLNGYTLKWKDDGDNISKGDNTIRATDQIKVVNPQDPSTFVYLDIVRTLRTSARGADNIGWQSANWHFKNDGDPNSSTYNSKRVIEKRRVYHVEIAAAIDMSKPVDWDTYKAALIAGAKDEGTYAYVAVVEGFTTRDGPPYQKKNYHLKRNLDLIDLTDPPLDSDSDLVPTWTDPFQTIINVSWSADYLIIALSVNQTLTFCTATLSDFNIPGWGGVAIEMTSTSGAIYPDGGGAAIGDIFVVSTKPSGAQGWKSPFNLTAFFAGPTELGSSYVAISLAAAKPNPTLEFTAHLACDPPPGINGGSYQPREILYTDAVAAWGPLPSDGGDPALWPLYHYGPVTDIIFGGVVIFYSNTPGVGGLYTGPPLDNPASIQKDLAEGLWGLPAGNTRWPPLVSLTPIPDPMPGPTFGQLIYQYLPSTEGLTPGLMICEVQMKTVRGLNKVVNPPSGWGVGAYAPRLPASATPGIVRATSMDIENHLEDNPPSDAPHCVIASHFDLHQTIQNFPYWLDNSVPGFPVSNYGDQDCILTEYNDPDPEASSPDTFGGVAVGLVPEDRDLGNPEQPALNLDLTGRFSVDLKTFAITRIA